MSNREPPAAGDELTFKCFYCGFDKPDAEQSDEHVIPSCIGGNRNVTLTRDVCGTCNGYMGKHVDQPFCRDWFIEAVRLLAGVKHRGKRPVTFMGNIGWARPERAGYYQLERGAALVHVVGADGGGRLLALLDPNDKELVSIVQNAIKAKFAGLPVINAQPPGTDAYNDGLVQDLMALGNQYNLQNQVSIVAWDRELVKMALGLAALTFGESFVTSGAADRLRAFLHEQDADRRAALGLRGSVGIANDTTPKLTAAWHPGGDEHLFGLIETDARIALVANLFGRFENFVEVSDDVTLLGVLPGRHIKGVIWLVDPDAKTTTAATPLEDVIRS